MGNCLDPSAKMKTDQNSQTTNSGGISKIGASRAASGPILHVPSYKERRKALSVVLPMPPRLRTEGNILSSPNLKAFSFNELKNATKNFSKENFLGDGGFRCVYKGWIDLRSCTASRPGSGIVVAVKMLKPEVFQGHKQWLVSPFFAFNYCCYCCYPEIVCSPKNKELYPQDSLQELNGVAGVRKTKES